MRGIYWIGEGETPRLAIVPRPRGGERLEDDLAALKDGGIDVLVSLLTADDNGDLGLSEEARVAAQVGLQFIGYPIPDRHTPDDLAGFQELVFQLRTLVAAGQRVGAHCQGCIGRSTVLIAAVMMAQGVPPEDALEAIERARGCMVPDTPEQREWILNFRPGP